MSQADALVKRLLTLESSVDALATVLILKAANPAFVLNDDAMQNPDVQAATQAVRQIKGAFYRRQLKDDADAAWFPDPPKTEAAGPDLSGLLAGLDVPSLVAGGLKQLVPLIEGMAAKQAG